jgi:hypothetical protein
MLKLFPRRHCAGFFAALCLAACGGAALIVPFFEFIFTNDDQSVGLSLFPAKPGTESGDFSRAELNISSPAGTVTTPYGGSYSACEFELKARDVVTPPAAASYSGRFINKDTIELRPLGDAAPIYTLKRRGGTEPTPDFGC